MNSISIIGTGYVGLVTGTCLSEFGLNVICMDSDAQKIRDLEEGRVPFYEIKQHIWRTSHLPRHWDGVREIDYVRAFRTI